MEHLFVRTVVKMAHETSFKHFGYDAALNSCVRHKASKSFGAIPFLNIIAYYNAFVVKIKSSNKEFTIIT